MSKNKRNENGVSIIILTLNEIDGVKKVMPRIPHIGEIIVVDGGSTDGTVEWLNRHKYKIIMQKSKGRGNAFFEGVAAAKGDVLIFFSPDGNEVPEHIPRLVEKIKEGCDMVIGSRFCKGATSEDAGPVRGFGNSMFTFLVNVFFGTRVTDCVNGFRAITREAFNELELDAGGFEIEMQMTIRAGKRGLNVCEIPTDEPLRAGGQSKAGTLAVGWRYVKTILRELVGG